ncbi:MAG: TadE/TadG family type IV pilus assembly protein, partial [Parasphingopyxis sp.]
MTRRKPPRPSRLLRRLRRDERGIALTEFAISLPLLLTLILGGLETANLALAHLRVSQIAMTVADNAGRVDTVIDESNIYEVFAGAELIGEAIDFGNNGRIVLSSLQHNGQSGSNEGQMINWQRCDGTLDIDPAYGVEGDGEDDDSLEDGLGPSGNSITSAEGTAVMFVEVTYEYEPLIA